MDGKKLGAFLRDLRTKKQYKQQEIAHQLHVTPQAISKWERGEGLPDFPLLLSLCNIYHITIDAMMEQKEEENETPYVFDAIQFGRTLKILRKSHGLSQKRMAIDFQITFQSISKWEKGISLPNYAMLERMKEYFQITYHSLFQYELLQKERRKMKMGIGIGMGFLIPLVILTTCLMHLSFHHPKPDSSMVPATSSETNTSDMTNKALVILYDGKIKFEEIQVEKGTYLTYVPMKEGYIFDYYAYDENLAKRFDAANTPIQENISLYIAWKNEK